jgi:hypothetical protein
MLYHCWDLWRTRASNKPSIDFQYLVASLTSYNMGKRGLPESGRSRYEQDLKE